MSSLRTRWAAIGAAIAISLGAGGIGLVNASSPPADEPGAGYYTIAPCRIIDTRSGQFNIGPRDTPIGQEETYVIDTRGYIGDCLFDAEPLAMSVNVTIVEATQPTFVTVFGAGEVPNASTVNASNSDPVANTAITPIGPEGQMSIYNRWGEVNVVIDVYGFFALAP